MPRLPVFDLNDAHTRSRLLIFSALTALNLVVVSLAGYGGITFMESTEFCGSCHSVMDPEHQAHEVSSHSRVECVGCHIGPGATWFVKSKLSGAWQVVSVTFDLYSKPIPTPVHALRPARGTCENCHLPARFVGDRLQIRTHFDSDEASTPLKTVLNLRVGGRGGTGLSGIHWHVGQGVEVRYQADPTRQKIYDVELRSPDGSKKLFKAKESAPAGTEWRVVDCIDCHNRPGHPFYLPEKVLDEALEAQKVDRSLPFVRREGLRLLNAATASHADAKKWFAAELHAFYSKAYPEIDKAKAAAIDASAEGLAEVYKLNVWPTMNIKWGSYPNNVGHPHRDDPRESAGCWRCHDDQHAERRRQDHLPGLHHVPRGAGRPGEGAGHPEDAAAVADPAGTASRTPAAPHDGHWPRRGAGPSRALAAPALRTPRSSPPPDCDPWCHSLVVSLPPGKV